MSAPTLRVDLHTHTHLSFDCLSEPDRILETMDRRGIDRIAVTDHNEIDAALAMHERHPDRFVVGEEVKTREGFDLIGLFLSERIPERTPAEETCVRIHEQGGVVYVPHPFDLARSGAGAHLARLARWVDVVEVHNARCWLRAFNRRALQWATEHGVLAGAGSDAHTLRELGAGLMELPRFEHTRDSFLGALAQGRIVCERRSSPLFRLSSTWAKLKKAIDPKQ